MSTVLEAIVSLCLLLGAAFALVGSIGLVRLPDLYSRLHGPTKATTLGVGGSVLGSALYFTGVGETLSIHEPLVVVFLFLTAPVSAHLLAKTALHMKVPNVSGAPVHAPGGKDDSRAYRGEAGDAP